jgi:hypothetical protein
VHLAAARERRLLAVKGEPAAGDALYWSARRMSPGDCTGMPSSEKAAAPASASSAISVSSAPSWPLVIAARKPTGPPPPAGALDERAETAAESTTGSVFGIARIAQ